MLPEILREKRRRVEILIVSESNRSSLFDRGAGFEAILSLGLLMTLEPAA